MSRLANHFSSTHHIVATYSWFGYRASTTFRMTSVPFSPFAKTITPIPCDGQTWRKFSLPNRSRHGSESLLHSPFRLPIPSPFRSYGAVSHFASYLAHFVEIFRLQQISLDGRAFCGNFRFMSGFGQILTEQFSDRANVAPYLCPLQLVPITSASVYES